ncbi:MAG: T9SS type A sorting domain-containing protein, partial [Flavobacteriaceae bacterium]
MKKLLLLIAICTFFSTNAQFNQNAPWMESFDLENRTSRVKFQDVVDAFNTYWETRDPHVKGSGYKPFKRWEAFWENLIDEDGFIPTSTDLWNTWLEKEARSATRDPLIDESNWISLGPTSFTNQSTSTANIGRVNVIVKDPSNANILYAGAPAGAIWKSIDSGFNWTALINDELPQIGVSGIVVDHSDPQTVYIATGDDDAGDSYSVGVWKSVDGGATWAQTGLNPSNSPTRMNDIYMHPTNSNILWVSTNNGLWKTTNAGNTWSNNLPGQNTRDVKIKPGDPQTVYTVTSSSFYKSTNGGDSFSVVTQGLPASSGRLVIDVTPANPNVVYVVSADTGSGYQGIYKSSNSGSTFVQTANATNIFESNQAWFDLALAVSDIDENEIYVGVLNIWKSTNGGNSFVQINSWFQRNASYTHADIHFLRFYDNELYAGTDGGYFKSTDGGTTFTDYTVGMEISQFYRIDVSEQTATKIAGGTQDNGGFGYFNQWSNYHGGDGMEGVIDPNNDNLYYGFMQFGQNLFVSNNSGQSGSQAYGGPENGNWITPLAVNSEGEVYGAYSRLYRFSTSEGFTAVSTNFGQDIDRLEIDPNVPDNIYLGINNVLWKSTDRGVTFTNVEAFSTNITSIEVNNNDSDVVYVTTAGSNGDIRKSVDGGLTFTDITGTFPNITKLVIKHRKNDPLNSLYVGTTLGVYRYDDNVGVWEEFDNNLPHVAVTDLAINVIDEKIIAGTYGRGIWQSDLATTELAQDDIRLVSVNDPTQNSFTCGDITPQITVKNNGQNVINDIDVTWSIDGGANTNFTWNGTLASEETTIIDLTTLSLPRGEHSLSVSVNITNDTFPNNNNSDITFFTNDAGVAQLINTFEDPADELISFNEGGGTPLWERGVPTGPDLNTAQSGTQVYGTNLAGNHPDLTKGFLLSQCYDLSAIVGPVLKFHMAFEIEFDWDLAYVEYTLDGGDSWSLLGTSNDPNWYNSSRIAGDGLGNNCFNCVGGQWTGQDTVMKEYSYDLDAFTNEPNVIFRMVYHSDQSVTFEGVIMDDFYVDGTLSTEEFSVNDVLIYPNPSNNIFNIKLKQVTNFNYTVTDIMGKIVLKDTNITRSTFELDMSNHASGLYFLNINA